jgi:hypothetical protein
MFQPLRSSAQFALAALLVSATIASAQPPPHTPLKTFQDSQYGVSFQYPSPWTFDLNMSFYISAKILQSGHRPLASVGFGGTQKSKYSPYPHTNLLGVQFVYLALPNATALQCQDAAKAGNDTAQSTPETINGVTYRHYSTGDAGMCHSSDEQIYAASRAGRCYLFEALLESACEDVAEGTRNITPAEIASVTKQLQQVMQSVQIPAKIDVSKR